MSLLWLLLPLGLGLSTLFAIAFARSVLDGQLDDLDTPPLRILCEECPPPPAEDPAP